MKQLFLRQGLQKLSRLNLLLSGTLLSYQLAIYAVDQSEFNSYSQIQNPIGQTDEIQNAPRMNVSNGPTPEAPPPPKTILINFNNVSIIEFIRFISRTTNKNFVFDENDLQFNVTIVSEEPATLENIMTALLQELRIHDLSLLEQGNNLIIHKNNKVNAVSQVVADDISATNRPSEIVTQVFKLNTADPAKVATVIKPLTSDVALVEVLPGTNHLIITDLSANVAQIAKLIKSVDSPNSGLVVGQYVVRTTSPDTLIDMAQKIITPISLDQPFTMVPWGASNSIFIVSTPYLVERTLSILQHIDQNQKTTKIFDLRELKYKETPSSELPPPELNLNGEPFIPTQEELEFKGIIPGRRAALPALPTEPGGVPGVPPPTFPPREGERETRPGISEFNKWLQSPNGSWMLQLLPQEAPKTTPPKGFWNINQEGDWTFTPSEAVLEMPTVPKEAPKGKWIIDPSGNWTYLLDQGESFSVKRLSRSLPPIPDIPLGVLRKTQFSIYKLQYRNGDTIQKSLQAIAAGLMCSRDPDLDLVDTMTCVQWLETSNSLIFTGYEDSLSKILGLMAEIDIPLRQVFIEMLVLETTIDDALEYSVTWGTRFVGQNWAGGEGFNQTGGPLITSTINNTLNSTGLNALQTPGIGQGVANNLFGVQGLNLGVIGQKLINTALGVEYQSIGALVQALRFKNNTNVIISPKIITEDSVPAEIFVGENIAFKTQSISNDLGNNITSNFQYRDVGTRFRVTPRLGNTDIITLEIAQEISNILPTAPGGGNINNQAQGPNTSKSTTTTRVHLPSGYFLIISGMMRDESDQSAIQVPCLGAIPIIGAAFKDKNYTKSKRNQMIFIRPIIIETEEEIQNLTKHQQDIWEFKKVYPIKKDWIYESEHALDFLNLRYNSVEDPDPIIEDTEF